jgi:uncharacterized membrane protein YqjE
VESPPTSEGLLSQAKQIFATGLAALQNRGELFLLELEEEKTHLVELLIWAMAVGLLGAMFLALLTVLVIWLFPPGLRVYAIGGLCLLYLGGTLLALLNLRSLLKHTPPPFSGTIKEIKKDSACLDSSK